jgi:DNA polymerase III alpha subunit
MWLNIKTEYSFGAVFGRVDDIVKKVSTMADYAGIADLGNTFGHVAWDKACRKYGVKPIFGVQLPIVKTLEKDKKKKAYYPHCWITLIARNNLGLQELYRLVDLAHQQFYYRPRLSYEQINKTSSDVLVLGDLDLTKYFPSGIYHRAISVSTPFAARSYCPEVPLIDNYFINASDKQVYESFADKRKLERKTTLMHIPTKEEWVLKRGEAGDFSQLAFLSSLCNATLSSAPMVEANIEQSLEELCEIGHHKTTGPIWSIEDEKRYRKELQIIKEKNFQDYFLIVADLVAYAKTKMLVGPARGSAAGSLICYFLGITEIDPIKYKLSFERFIDANRLDLPDIDIDFQDDKRHLLFSYLKKKYGEENVAQIANINRLKPKSALNRIAKALSIPLGDVEEIKIMTDNLQDTFQNSDIGKAFLEKYPAMRAAAKAEGHASHMGIHAAGVLVCPEPTTNYCGINSRDGKRIAMIDKREAEALSLLKIDVLGLRTLSIIAETCDDINKEYNWIYQLPRDDKKTFHVFNSHRFEGIFQFEGEAIRKLAMRMPFESIEDIAALSALGRPGPLESGAAWDYVHARAGRKPIKWISEHPAIQSITSETYGVIVYQEQVMRIVREVGKFSWAQVNEARKAIGKKKPEELKRLGQMFIDGCLDQNLKGLHAAHIWKQIETFGGYAFNKSHAISYGLISYICAYLKAHHPLEFTKACLNHAKDDNSALRILRDAVENDGIFYCYFSHKRSMQKWSISHPINISTMKEKILLGGFLSIKGIGPAAANKIVKLRKEGKELPPGIQKHLNADISSFKYLYPAQELYGEYYDNPQSVNLNYSCAPIVKIKETGKYNIVGKLIKKDVRDSNEPSRVMKRGGEYESGQTSWLNLTLQDDTGVIMVQIRKQDYHRLGRLIAETGKEDEDWYLVHGEKITGYNLLFAINIMKITK